MLTRLTLACFAHNHSPETEQRLLLFATKNPHLRLHVPDDGPEDEMSEGSNDNNESLSAVSVEKIAQDIQRITRDTRQKLEFLRDVRGIDVHLDKMPDVTQEKIISKFLDEHREYIQERFPNVKGLRIHSEENVLSNSMRIYQEIRNLLSEDEVTVIEPLGNDVSPDYLTAEDYKKRYSEFLAKETGRSKEDTRFEVEMDSSKMPSAFNFGTRLVFNIDHPDFREDMQTDEAKKKECKIRRQMAAMHEVMHFELLKPNRGQAFISEMKQEFVQLGVWEQLKQNVDAIFGNSIEQAERVPARADYRYVHEVLSMYYTALTDESIDDSRVNTIRSIVDGALKSHEGKTHMKYQLDAALNQNLLSKINLLKNDAVSGYQTTHTGLMRAIEERTESKNTWDYLKDRWGLRDNEYGDENDPDAWKTQRIKNPAVTLAEMDDLKKAGGPLLTPEMTTNYWPEHYNANQGNPDVGPMLLTNAPIGEHGDTLPEGIAPEEEDEESAKDIISADKVLVNIEGMQTRLQRLKDDLKKMENMPLDRLAPQETGDIKKQFATGLKISDELISSELVNMISLHRYATDLKNWEETGKVDLKTKNNYAKQWAFSNAAEYDRLASQGRANASDVQTADMNSRSDRERVLLAAKSAMDKVKEPVDAIESFVTEGNQMIKNKDESKIKTMREWLRKKLGHQGGIEWLCWYDLVKIVKIYKDGIVESYHAQQNISTTRVARQTSWIMDYIPWGAPVRQIIDRQARSANEEETSKYMEFLEKSGFDYDNIFEPGGVLDQSRGNINRFKAVLLYSAGHAWLYEFRKNASGVYDGNNVYGIDYIDAFGKEQFKELVQKNESGKKHAVDEGYERIDKDADVRPIIDVLMEELHEKNLFRALGIIKRLQEKAKFAYSNTWAATTILERLRHDESLRKILDKGFLDQIGGIGISQSAWTLTMFKTLRTEMMAWKDGKYDNIDSGGTNPLGQAILLIENKLDAGGIAFATPKDKNEAVAEILSARTYRNGGVTISIFQNEFNFYRNYWQGTETTTSAKDTDDDWFNPDNGGADILLLGVPATMDILKRESQGPFVERVKGPNYFAQVFMRDNDLSDIPDAQENFRREMKIKMDYYLGQLQGAAQPTTLVDRTGKYRNAKGVSRLPILAELAKRNMVDAELFLKYTNANIGSVKSIPPKELEEAMKTLAADKNAYKHRRAA